MALARALSESVIYSPNEIYEKEILFLYNESLLPSGSWRGDGGVYITRNTTAWSSDTLSLSIPYRTVVQVHALSTPICL